MLELKNVSKYYYSKGIITTGLTKINLEMKMGEFIAITGESGSGKSTLLNVISGLDSYEDGEMYINGKETSHYTEKDFEEYRRKYIANIFQNFNLINSYTVYQNVELVLLLNGYKKRQIKKKVLDIIEQVGLTKFKNTKVSKLSGGQKQRVAIARAMVKDTPIIVADEPTGNLDSESAKDVIEILRKVAKDKLVIVVTHNLEQIEEYATRIIKMHDGRIVENQEIKKVDNNIKVEESKYFKITLINKYRLGIRNTFNIFSKFVLLFLVFFFIVSAIFLEYGSFKLYENLSSKTSLYSMMFDDISENRIIIKKSDKTYFTEEDYKKIKNLSNTDYIVENDLFIDRIFSFEADTDDYSYMMYMSGNINSIDNFEGALDIGRMPENDNEIVVIASKKHSLIENKLDEFLNTEFTIGEVNISNIKVVGVKYSENDNDYNFKIYVSNNMIETLRGYINSTMCDLKIIFEENQINTDMYIRLLPNKEVEKGKVIIDSAIASMISNKSVKNKSLSINVSNIYYESTIDLKIDNTYTKSNFKKLTGLSKYDENRYVIFMNEEDYNSLYYKPSYQSSVYIKNVEEIETTMQELKNLGLIPKKASDYAIDNYGMSKQILRITTVIVTIIVIFVLFFISYFIIRIILASRKTYYTTLRILGATYKNVRRILDIELFINSSIAFAVSLIFIYLVRANIIELEYIKNITDFIGIKEYVLMYLVLVIMSRLISRRFSKKIFKKTAMNTYKEEV